MEDWPKDLFKMLETAAVEVEQFFKEVTEEVSEMVEAFAEFSSDMAELSQELTEELHSAIFTEFDQFFNELVDPILDAYLGIEEIAPDPDMFVSFEEPTQERHTACVGCKHYHGQVYGGNLLVCGMHPYGWEEENCPDWEGGDSFMH